MKKVPEIKETPINSQNKSDQNNFVVVNLLTCIIPILFTVC